MPFNPFVAATAPAVFINSAMRYGARQSTRQLTAAQSVTTRVYIEHVCVSVWMRQNMPIQPWHLLSHSCINPGSWDSDFHKRQNSREYD